VGAKQLLLTKLRETERRIDDLSSQILGLEKDRQETAKIALDIRRALEKL